MLLGTSSVLLILLSTTAAESFTSRARDSLDGCPSKPLVYSSVTIAKLKAVNAQCSLLSGQFSDPSSNASLYVADNEAQGGKCLHTKGKTCIEGCFFKLGTDPTSSLDALFGGLRAECEKYGGTSGSRLREGGGEPGPGV